VCDCSCALCVAGVWLGTAVDQTDHRSLPREHAGGVRGSWAAIVQLLCSKACALGWFGHAQSRSTTSGRHVRAVVAYMRLSDTSHSGLTPFMITAVALYPVALIDCASTGPGAGCMCCMARVTPCMACITRLAALVPNRRLEHMRWTNRRLCTIRMVAQLGFGGLGPVSNSRQEGFQLQAWCICWAVP